MSGALVKRAEGLLGQPRRRGRRGRPAGVPPPRHAQRGRRGHASASAPQRARGPRRRSPDAALGARHVRSPPPAQLRSRPDDAEPDGRDLPRGVAHRVDAAARLDRRGRGTTSVSNGDSPRRCASGSPRTAPTAYLLRGGLLEQVHGWVATTSVQLSGPEQAFLDASVAERDREAAELAGPREPGDRGRAPPAATWSSTPRRRSRGGARGRPRPCSGPCSGVRRPTPSATSRTCSVSIVSSPPRRPHAERRSGARPAARDAVRARDRRPRVTPPRRRSTPCTSRSRSSGSSTTSIPQTPVAARAGTARPRSACMRCRRTS